MMKNLKLLACLLAVCSMMSACNVKKDAEDAKDKVEEKADTAKRDVEDSIDNVMNYFKDKGVSYEHDAKIENMDFAAYEGRSFVVNGSTAYLYRVKNDDDNMKKVMKEAADKGKVKVHINNKEMEYGAKVNGDYLFLYDTNADMNDVLQAFPGYAPGTTTTTTSANQEDSKDTTNPTDGTDNENTEE